MSQMNLEDYTSAMGKIVVNLHSLEFALRNFLWGQEDRQGLENWNTCITQLQVGQSVPVNAFSNYDTLKKLIAKFNNVVQLIDSGLCVDPDIVTIRDAIAHGRIWASNPQPPMQLVKFDIPKNGTVTVTHTELIDDNWLKVQKTRLFTEIQKVVRAGQKPSPQSPCTQPTCSFQS
jgi:hypothetical protein